MVKVKTLFIEVALTLTFSFVISLTIFLNFQQDNLTRNERIARAKIISRNKFGRNRVPIERFCNSNDPNVNEIKAKHFNEDFVNSVMWHEKNHGMLWCCNYKAGSTNMIKHIETLGGYDHNQLIKSFEDQNIPQQDFRNLIQKLFQMPSNTPLANVTSNTLTVVFVRHPFVRFVSGYLDKMMKGTIKFGEKMSYKLMKEYILENYRKSKNLTDPLPYPTPEEFSKFILDEVESRGASNLDIHFQPQGFNCPYCNIDFDAVVLSDELDIENISFLAEMLGFAKKISLNTDVNRTLRGEDVETKALKFFSQLSDEIILKLFLLYKVDFDMFGFPPPTKYFRKNEDLLNILSNQV